MTHQLPQNQADLKGQKMPYSQVIELKAAGPNAHCLQLQGHENKKSGCHRQENQSECGTISQRDGAPKDLPNHIIRKFLKNSCKRTTLKTSFCLHWGRTTFHRSAFFKLDNLT